LWNKQNGSKENKKDADEKKIDETLLISREDEQAEDVPLIAVRIPELTFCRLLLVLHDHNLPDADFGTSWSSSLGGGGGSSGG
jgi:hypothetical protein